MVALFPENVLSKKTAGQIIWKSAPQKNNDNIKRVKKACKCFNWKSRFLEYQISFDLTHLDQTVTHPTLFKTLKPYFQNVVIFYSYKLEWGRNTGRIRSLSRQ